MKKIFLSIVLLVSLRTGYAQVTSTKVSRTVPPSPTAAALGSYGNYPLSDFRGVPSINIPLIDIELRKTKLPLSLSYDASGIKVEQIASWVGLGWSLNCGGVITRNVMDKPDDYNHNSATMYGLLYGNYYVPGYVSNPPGVLNAVALDVNTTDMLTMSKNVRAISHSGFDTQPDIFYFNFNGKSGKFLFKPELNGVSPIGRQILTVPYQELKIEYNLAQDGYSGNVATNGSIAQFIVTDTNGDRYYFDVPEVTYYHTYGKIIGVPEDETESVDWTSWEGSTVHTGYYNALSPVYTSAWYLSKLVTAQKDTVNFSYADESYIYDIANNAQALTSPINLSDADGCKISPNDFMEALISDRIRSPIM